MKLRDVFTAMRVLCIFIFEVAVFNTGPVQLHLVRKEHMYTKVSVSTIIRTIFVNMGEFLKI